MTLSVEQQEAVATLARYFGPALADARDAFAPPATSILDFGSRNFYVPETQTPIRFHGPQPQILGAMFDADFARACGLNTGFQTYIYSAIKKSGKTSIAALAARWVAETWGRFNEVYSIANDKEQARGRVYAKALQSIELDPNYNRLRSILPGKWRVIEREAKHLPTGSYMRAVSSDYKGEAGSNPTATFWSELWGYTLEASRRLWDEMTPVPTRPRSIRYVETYAGFIGESTLLINLYDLATKESRGAHRLTATELADLSGGKYIWPYPDEHELPLYINPSARLFTYWDVDEPIGRARRMPWQTNEYYAGQAAELRPDTFDRLHRNFWVSPTSAFLPAEWWESCSPSQNESPLPPLRNDEPVVLAADASVSGDCTALVGVTRDPRFRDSPNLEDRKRTVARLSRCWTPPAGGNLNYNSEGGLKQTIREWCAKYNVVELTYDPYQLHDVMTVLRDEGVVWTRPFSQGDERMIADFTLYVDIRDRKITNDTKNPEIDAHIANAAAKVPKDQQTKLRIVKRSQDAKIDLVVTLSMANMECKRLML